MKILFYDCFAGISGDMNLAAMIGLGVDPEHLRTELSKLGLDHEFALRVATDARHGIVGVRVDVVLTHEAAGHDHGHAAAGQASAHGHHHGDHTHPHEHGPAHDHHHGDHDHPREHGHEHGHLHGDHTHPHEHGPAHGHHHGDHDHPREHGHEQGHLHEDHVHPHEHGHEPGQAHQGHHHEHGPNRNLADIEAIIQASALDDAIKATSLRIFRQVAEAEARVHGKPVDEVHFHEVGATDSIVDIVGAAICFHQLGVDAVWSSPVELGGGFVHCAHGCIPVPAPATIEILQGIPTTRGAVKQETATPTGAAILATLVDTFTAAPAMVTQKTAYGVGHRDMDIPNLLRVHLAEVDRPGKG